MMTFYFEKELDAENTFERAYVRVTIDEDTQMVKFDVDLDSLPGSKLDGFEVITDFTVENFNNNKTFYTDSNGLEM
jgi:hypothetical protein